MRVNKGKRGSYGGNYRRLYHITSADAATKIVKDQTFFRGKDGWVGGGIYFAKSPKEAALKTLHKGVCLDAWVELGRMLEVSTKRVRKYTNTELKKRGFNSVHLSGAKGGEEFVVYNYGQVTDIRITKV
jgi:hypothetical protein